MATRAGGSPTYTGNAKLAGKRKLGIVVSDWNPEVTDALLESAVKTLRDAGIASANVVVRHVPGSYELPLSAQWLAQDKSIQAVIALGCVIQGETPHFDYICQAVAQGLKDVALKFDKPVVFGVLTTLTRQQALDRAGGKLGNKGEEAAHTALAMLNFGR
jgi:6,7-dimethyl-8-ribityllumazine synthase